MKILHVNTTDTSGSGIAARRINKALNEKDIKSDLLVLDRTVSDNQDITGYYDNYTGKYNKVKALFQRHLLPSYHQFRMGKINKNTEMFTFPNSLIDIRKHELYKNADLIHLHFISDFVDIPSFFKKNKKPVVWTLHDLNPVTGGLHVHNDFENDSHLEKISKKNFEIKKKAYNYVEKMCITAPSQWMLDESLKSGLFDRFEHSKIPNGVDLKLFKPLSKEFCKDILNIPNDRKKIILFIADDFNLKNKGKNHFNDIYNEFKAEYNYIIVGKNTNNIDFHKPGIINLGYINSELLLPVVYSAADVTIVPSIKESFSLVTIESLACGTPVAAFNTTGPAEIIEHLKSGYLAEPGNSIDLIKGVSLILESENNNEFKQNAVYKAKDYDIMKIADSFLDIYKKLL